MVYSFTADVAQHYNSSSSHPSIFCPPLLILNQSHGSESPSNVWATGRNTPRTRQQSLTGHTHTLMPRGDSVSIQPIVHVFLECGRKVSLGFKGP